MRFAAIAAILSLAADVEEPALVLAVTKLKADHDAATALHAAELEAHAATRAKLVKVDGELAALRSASTEAEVDGLIVELRRKAGQKLGADNKPIRGGTPAEQALLQYAGVDMKLARTFVEQHPQLLQPVPGTPPISRHSAPPVSGEAGRLTEQQKKIAKQLGIPEDRYLATESLHDAPVRPIEAA